MSFWNSIDKYGTYVSIGVEKNLQGDFGKQVNNILKLFHILMAVGINEDETVIKLLLDTLVGLGLTITDGKNLVEELVKDMCKGDET